MTEIPEGDRLMILAAWSLTLTEPLLSTHRRAVLEDGLARVHVQSSATAELFLAGLVSDLMQTLPERDPWRSLAARSGDVQVGDPPEGLSGGVLPDGTVFGSWRNATDLIPLVHQSAYDDPALAALAGDDLDPDAAVVLAAGARGWRETRDVLASLREQASAASDGASVTELETRRLWRTGAAIARTRTAAVQAVRWAVHRRRGYIGCDDAWVEESAYRWAWRSTRDPVMWSEEDVERALVAERVREPAPQDREDDDSDLF